MKVTDPSNPPKATSHETPTTQETSNTKPDKDPQYDKPLSFDPFEHGTVVVPPEDIRSAADKTAEYVFKHGSSFEDQVKIKQQNNNQFQFLWPKTQYYAYYRWKLNSLAMEQEDQEQEEKENLVVEQAIKEEHEEPFVEASKFLFDPSLVDMADNIMDKVNYSLTYLTNVKSTLP
jgi:hypothetical protein